MISNDYITFNIRHNEAIRGDISYCIPLNDLEKYKYIMINLGHSYGLGNDEEKRNRKIIYRYINKYLYHNYAMNPPYIIKDVDIYLNDKLCFMI